MDRTSQRNTSQLTDANLTSHSNSKTTGHVILEKQTMERFHQERDQYRHFIVTGDNRDCLVQKAKHYGMNGGISGSAQSA